MATPPMNDRITTASESQPIGHAPVDQLPGDKGRERGHLALREIEVIDRLIDHHDGERHAGVDRAVGEAGHYLLQQQLHRRSPLQ